MKSSTFQWEKKRRKGRNDKFMRKLRLSYAIALMVVLLIEIGIALFVHDDFIRPYVGDVLVVVVLYCLVRIIKPNGVHWLPLAIFIFAAFVEVLQYFDIVKLLGLGNNRFLRVLIGTTFDGKDVLCYGTGCMMLLIFEIGVKKRSAK